MGMVGSIFKLQACGFEKMCILFGSSNDIITIKIIPQEAYHGAEKSVFFRLQIFC